MRKIVPGKEIRNSQRSTLANNEEHLVDYLTSQNVFHKQKIAMILCKFQDCLSENNQSDATVKTTRPSL